MRDDQILVQKDSGIGTIIFNRPEMRNAINYQMWSRIPDIMRDFEQDDEVRVAVVRGAGDRAFIAGADIHGSHSRVQRACAV